MRVDVPARGEDVADGGSDDDAEPLDGVADHLLRHAAEVDLAKEPVDTELGVQVENLLRNLRRPAHYQRTPARSETGHRRPVDMPPAAAVDLRGQVTVVVRVELVQRLLGGLADVEVAGDADGQLLLGVAGVAAGGPVEVDEPFGVVHGAADEPERHRQAELASAEGAGGGAADRYPNWQGAERLRVGGCLM
jgi:hypothetical protein